MVTLNLTSFGTTPSLGDISQALSDASVSSMDVNRVVVAQSVTLPDYAFTGWTYLSSVDNLDTCVAIGSSAFAYTDIGTGNYGVTVDIGNCSMIGERAFYSCGALQHISLASGITIPDECFGNCTSLANVVNLNHVVSIGAAAFHSCRGLTSVDLGDCRFLGISAFENCQGISEVTLCPNGVTFDQLLYGNYHSQFTNCGSLQRIFNLEYQTQFPPDAVDYCSSLQELRLDNCTTILYADYRSTTWDLGPSSCLSKVTLNEGLWGPGYDESGTQVCPFLYGLQSTINQVDIMYSFSTTFSICAGLFDGCSNLTSVDGYAYNSGDYSPGGTDPKVSLSATGLRDCGVIGSGAFRETKIGWGLYGKSGELANIVQIGIEAFRSAHIGESGDFSEQGGPDSNRGLWVDRNCVHMGAYAFADNPNLRWIGLPGPSSYSSVYTVSDVEALVGSRRLQLESCQFSGCSGLSNIINLEFQRSFSTNAIVRCNSLPFLNLFYIDNVGVDYQTDMQNVPVSYIHVGPTLASQLDTMVSMFRGCSMLDHVIVATSTGADGFQFSIPDGCFSGISTLTSVDGLYSCSGIGAYAFAGTSIEFNKPDQLMYARYIGESAFDGCQYVDVNYLGNCQHIGPYAFENNSNISELIFGPSMEYIGEMAFVSCTNLYAVYFNNDKSWIPNITLDTNAFADCSNLTNVCLTNTPQTVSFENGCFQSTGLEHLYNLDTVIDGSFGDYMLYNTNVQENRITTSNPNAFNDNTFAGVYHDWYLPNIYMSQVPMDTKWGIESGYRLHLKDDVISSN